MEATTVILTYPPEYRNIPHIIQSLPEWANKQIIILNDPDYTDEMMQRRFPQLKQIALKHNTPILLTVSSIIVKSGWEYFLEAFKDPQVIAAGIRPRTMIPNTQGEITIYPAYKFNYQKPIHSLDGLMLLRADWTQFQLHPYYHGIGRADGINWWLYKQVVDQHKKVVYIKELKYAVRKYDKLGRPLPPYPEDHPHLQPL